MPYHRMRGRNGNVPPLEDRAHAVVVEAGMADRAISFTSS